MNEVQHVPLLMAILGEDWRAVDRLADSRPLDPRSFIALIRQCDVHPWVHARLADAGRLDRFGPEVRDELDRLRHKVRVDNLALLARAEQALDLLLRAGIVPVVLKGLDVLHRLYGQFDERTMDDVDILVRRDQVAPALRALEDAGWGSLPPESRNFFLRSCHHLPLSGPGPIVVEFELHWHLVQAGKYTLNIRDLIGRAVPVEIGGRRVLRLDDHDLAAHLLLHHFTHYFDRRLKWAIDLSLLLSRPGFDWSVVAERVREWGATAAVGMSVLHLNKLFPAWITDEVVALMPATRWRRAVTAPLRSSHPLDLFRATRKKKIQLYLAAAMLENPWGLPGWLIHRARRAHRPELSPLAGDGRRGDAPERGRTGEPRRRAGSVAWIDDGSEGWG